MTDRLILDGTNLTHRCYHALAASGNEPDPTAVADTVRRMVARWRRDLDLPAGRCLAAFDAGDSGRKAIYPEYKGNRGERSEALIHALSLAPLAIRSEHIGSVAVPGFEADDTIATLELRARASEPDSRNHIVSGDRDLLQLLDLGHDGTPATCRTRAHLLGFKATDVTNWDGITFRQEREFPPCFLPLYNALVGEKGDNIPGVPGIGPVWATRLVARTYRTADPVIALTDPDSILYSTLPIGVQAKLIDQHDIIRRNLQLTTLRRDVPLPGGFTF